MKHVHVMSCFTLSLSRKSCEQEALEAVIRTLVWYLLTLLLGRRNPEDVKRVCTPKYTMSEPNDTQFFKDRHLVKGCSPLLCYY